MKDSTKLSKQDVEHVATLARLELTPTEITQFTAELGSVLDMADSLNEVDTSNLEETAHVTGLSNVTRQDETVNQLTIEQSLANAPLKDGRYFKVPKVL